MYGMVLSLTSTEQVYTLAEDMQHLVILLWPSQALRKITGMNKQSTAQDMTATCITSSHSFAGPEEGARREQQLDGRLHPAVPQCGHQRGSADAAGPDGPRPAGR